jgi:dTDP-4-dehydrorhamnose reductase
MNRDFRGLIHVVGSERISKYDFAWLIAKEFDLDSRLITPTSYLDTDFAKTRSADLSLSNAKLMSLGLSSSSISSGLKLLKQEIGI